MPTPWKILESKQLLKDQWVDVQVHSCLKPDGSIITPYYVYSFPNYACALAFNEKQEVILVKVYRHGLNVVATELPGGCIDAADISNEKAMSRELYEETGYTFNHIEYLGYTSPNPSTNNNVMHMFLATGGVFDSQAILDVGEGLEIFTVSLPTLVQMLKNNDFIQSMQTCVIYAALQKMGILTFNI